MKVRATQDGTYAGYYRMGPTEDGQFPGEIFEIDDKPFEVRDPETGKALYELDDDGKPVQLFDEKGKAKYDSKGKALFKIRMDTWFSPKWMERVADHIETTFDYPPFELPVSMRAKKPKASGNPSTMTVHSPDVVPSVI